MYKSVSIFGSFFAVAEKYWYRSNAFQHVSTKLPDMGTTIKTIIVYCYQALKSIGLRCLKDPIFTTVFFYSLPVFLVVSIDLVDTVFSHSNGSMTLWRHRQ